MCQQDPAISKCPDLTTSPTLLEDTKLYFYKTEPIPFPAAPHQSLYDRERTSSLHLLRSKLWNYSFSLWTFLPSYRDILIALYWKLYRLLFSFLFLRCYEAPYPSASMVFIRVVCAILANAYQGLCRQTLYHLSDLIATFYIILSTLPLDHLAVSLTCKVWFIRKYFYHFPSASDAPPLT